MPDAGFAHPPFLRVLDANAQLVSGAKLKFYEAGTDTPRAVYSDSSLSTSLGAVVYCDSAGYPVASQGSSTKVEIYTGTTAYKLEITDANDVPIVSARDNLIGALDTSSFTGGGGSGITSVVSSGSTTISVGVTANDDGKLYNLDPSGGLITVTLGSAVTAGDGFTFVVKHGGALSVTNGIKVVTTSSQIIQVNGKETESMTLEYPGHSIYFASDGAEWIAFMQTQPDIITRQPIPITDRTNTPPSNPDPGAKYIISTTPISDWSSYTVGDIIEADGQGGWIQYTPQTDCGWLAYVLDENLLTQWRDSAWVDLSNVTAPDEEALSHAMFTHSVAANTAGGDSVASAWTDRTLNTDVVNTIDGCTRNSSDITLPAGTYSVRFMSSHYDSGSAYKVQVRFKSTTTSKEVQGMTPGAVSTGENQQIFGDGIITLSAEETFTLEYYSNAAESTNGLGLPANLGSQPELYAWVNILRLEAPQGPRGPSGPSLDDLTILGNTIASATTLDLDQATGDLVDVSGTTTITAITLTSGRVRTVRFTGALTLTHGASLVLPGAANITTAAGDIAMFRGYGSGVVRCVFFSRYTGFPVIEPKRMMDITLYRSPQTALVGPTAASWDWPGTGVSASIYQFFANQLNGHPLSLAQWRAVWDPNVTGPATTGIRLVTADSGPSNISAIASLTASGVGSVRNDATDITSDLNTLIAAGTYKQIGHQMIGDGSSAAANVYSSILEIIW